MPVSTVPDPKKNRFAVEIVGQGCGFQPGLLLVMQNCGTRY
jgi:hypothetical protein